MEMYSYNKKQESRETEQAGIEPVSRPLVGEPSAETIKELAAISNYIYTPHIDLLPAGWICWGVYNFGWYPSPYDDLGFNGAILYKLERYKPIAWAISIRGTVPSNFDNIIDDLRVMLEKVPLQIKTAKAFIDREITRLKNSPFRDLMWSWDRDPIYITGHSLGALIANMLFADMSSSTDARIHCVGFDNPGSLNIVRDYLQKNGKGSDVMNSLVSRVRNIQADVNIINTCNPQWGAVYRVLRWNFNYGETARVLLPISKSYMFNYHYLTVYSINDQHQKVLEAIKNGYSLHLFNSSPAGFAAGYKAYIDGEDRKEYWTQYFKYCWDIDVVIRDTYKDFDKFAVRMFADLKKALDDSGLVIDVRLLENADEELINSQTSNA